MQKEHNASDWKKQITLFMTGQSISLFGSALVEFAVIWHITLLTKSGVMMTIGTTCVFLPRLFISLFSGVWADRYNRKKLIIWADAGIALVTFLLAIVFLLGYQELWLIFLALGIRSVGTGIQSPAVSAIIPQIVPEKMLLKVNSINGSVQSFTMLAAPAVSAGLLSFLPLGAIFFIDVATAAIGISIMTIIPVKTHEKSIQKQTTGYYDDLKEGIRYMKQNVFVKEMLIMYTFYFFLITPTAFLSQIAVARNFGAEAWRLSALEIAFSGGMMLGGGILAWWGGFKNGMNTIAMSCFIIGITVSMLAYPNFYVFIAMMLVMGIFGSFFYSTEASLFQKTVDPNKQGRVFGLVDVVMTAILPLGMFVFGPLGDVIPLEIIFLVCGILIVFLSFYIFFNKRLKNAANVK